MRVILVLCMQIKTDKRIENMRVILILLIQIIFFATSYVTPLALICGLYLWLLLRLWRGAAPGGHVSEESRRGKRRVTRMVVVVVAIFAVCWFPIQVRTGSGTVYSCVTPEY
jgi:chromate transport protein ChrA